MMAVDSNHNRAWAKRNIVGPVATSLILVALMTGWLKAGAQENLPKGSNARSFRIFQQALQQFDLNNSEKCVRLAGQSIRISPGFTDAYILLGDCYLELDSGKRAADSYRKAIDLGPDRPDIAINLLANTLFDIGNYKEAVFWYDSLLSFPLPIDFRENINHRIKLGMFRDHALSDPVRFEPVNLGSTINTGDEEYINVLSADGRMMIFTRRSPNPDPSGSNPKQFREDFYQSFYDGHSWSEAALLGYPATTGGDAGGLCYSPDGRLLFFTACFRPDSRGSCDIYYSEKAGDDWSAPRNLGDIVNSDLWDSQPAISPDGKTLYFASNREGSLGGSDIWKTVKNEKGEWTKPVNLGKPVNTTESEMSPFIHYDNRTLYFSSSGHLGMGGADLFRSVRKATGWSVPENLGFPVNTAANELVLYIDPEGSTGYLSSDSLKGYGKFDIYRFAMPMGSRPLAVTYIRGVISDAEDQAPLEAVFDLIDVAKDSLVTRSRSDRINGEFLICLPTGRNYALNVSRPGYLFHSEHFALEGIHGELDPYRLDIRLQKIRVGEVTVLKNIFFDTDRYDLKPESMAELIRLAQFLRDNPGLGIEIGGHTDNTGTKEYNDGLSENRAKAVYLYLIESGIEAGRLTYMGYGYSVPVAGNETEEGRALNRRTEMKIVSLPDGQ